MKLPTRLPKIIVPDAVRRHQTRIFGTWDPLRGGRTRTALAA
ncbi:hypothetical protein [Micromonospora alfalfae]|nr:hypothetical protein [Micromonospora alfalfae]